MFTQPRYSDIHPVKAHWGSIGSLTQLRYSEEQPAQVRYIDTVRWGALVQVGEVHWYRDLRYIEGKKRFSRQFATRHCTALSIILPCIQLCFNTLIQCIVRDLQFCARCTFCPQCAFLCALGAVLCAVGSVLCAVHYICNTTSHKPGGMHEWLNSAENWNVHFSQKEIRHYCPVVGQETCCLALQVNCHVLVQLSYLPLFKFCAPKSNSRFESTVSKSELL